GTGPAADVFRGQVLGDRREAPGCRQRGEDERQRNELAPRGPPWTAGASAGPAQPRRSLRRCHGTGAGYLPEGGTGEDSAGPVGGVGVSAPPGAGSACGVVSSFSPGRGISAAKSTATISRMPITTQSVLGSTPRREATHMPAAGWSAPGFAAGTCRAGAASYA